MNIIYPINPTISPIIRVKSHRYNVGYVIGGIPHFNRHTQMDFGPQGWTIACSLLSVIKHGWDFVSVRILRWFNRGSSTNRDLHILSFPKSWGYPPVIIQLLNGIFHEINHPASLGYHHFRKPQYCHHGAYGLYTVFHIQKTYSSQELHLLH